MTKALLSLFSLPLVTACLYATFICAGKALSDIRTTAFLLLGFFLYAPLHGTISRNGYAYILAHELSHALAAMLSGIRVNRVSIARRSGYILTKGSSAAISLAPYFIPFYSIVLAVLYFSAGALTDMRPYRQGFLFLTGFTLAFHAAQTIAILSGPLQSDLKKAGGRLFSYSVITAMNCLVLTLMLKLLFPEHVSVRNYILSVGDAVASQSACIKRAVLFAFNTAKIYTN